MDIRLLGPIELRSTDGHVDLGPPKLRAVFALLAVEAGTVVTAERLEDSLWRDRSPGDVRRALHTYLARLRRILAPIEGLTLERRSGGYVLDAPGESIDLHRFHNLCATARNAVTTKDAARLWQRALSEWNGTPFDDVDAPGLHEQRHELLAMRELAELDRNDAFLAEGRHSELLPELTIRCAERLLDQRLAGQYMLSLHRLGRTDEALEHYRKLRGRLVNETGNEPGAPLRELQARLLREEDVEPAAADVIVPRQLPGCTPVFTGREEEMSRALRALSGSTGDNPAIVAVDGMAGVGKTTFAIKVSTVVAKDFPDGQLFVSLRGFSDKEPPVDPLTALGAMLRDLGAPPSRVPDDQTGRAALLRTMLADKRVLVVLDDARDGEQVRDLLPGASDSAALITSRRKLTALHEVRAITLNALARPEAITLFSLIAGREPDEHMGDIADRSGRLPLAIRLAASHLQARPSWSTADLNRRLKGRFPIKDQVINVIDLSFQALGSQARSRFAMLSMIPGPSFSLSAATALIGGTADSVERSLEEFVDLNLVEAATGDRYRMHDLLRKFARVKLESQRRHVPMRRLYDWYVAGAESAAAAARLQAPLVPRATDAQGEAPRFATPAEAMTWLDTESPSLLGAVTMASDTEDDLPVWQLVDALAGYLLVRGEAHCLAVAAQVGLAAAQRRSDRDGEAHMLLRLGDAALTQLRLRSAVGFARQALRLLEADAAPLPRIRAFTLMSESMKMLGHNATASKLADRGLAIHRSCDDDRGAEILMSAAMLDYDTGDLAGARRLLEEAVKPLRRFDCAAFGQLLSTLSAVCLESGDIAAAERYMAEHRSLSWVGDVAAFDAGNQRRLALLHHARGEAELALTHAQRALAAARKIHDRFGEAQALVTLARVERERPATAAAHAREAAILATRVESSRVYVAALQALADAQICLGEHEAALSNARSALAIAQRHEFRTLEATVLASLTEALLASGDLIAAKQTGATALARCDQTGHRSGQARVHQLLSAIHRTGDADVARQHAAAADALYHRMGVPPRPGPGGPHPGFHDDADGAVASAGC